MKNNYGIKNLFKIYKFNYQILYIISVDKQQEYDNNQHIHKCIFMKVTVSFKFYKQDILVKGNYIVENPKNK